MTDNQLESILDEMESLFGTLPNPEVYPRQFAFFVKFYYHLLSLKQKETTENNANTTPIVV